MVEALNIMAKTTRKPVGEKAKNLVVIKKEDVFALARNSYTRFEKRLPKIIADQFPVEVKKNGHTYKIELDDVRCSDAFSSATYRGEAGDEDAAIAHCVSKGETLFHRLWSTFRLYKDGHMISQVRDRQILEYPALTSTANFVLSGNQKVLKTEQSMDGTTFSGCGEVLEQFFRNCDFKGLLTLDLPDIAEGTKDKRTNRPITLSNYEFKSFSKVVKDLLSRKTLINVNGQNPWALISSNTMVYHDILKKVDEDTGSAFTNRGRIGTHTLVYESIDKKKEGPNALINGGITLFTIINDEGKLVTPLHPVKNGVVQKEIEYVSIDSLPPVMEHLEVGTKVPEDQAVLYSYEAEMPKRNKNNPDEQPRYEVVSKPISYNELNNKFQGSVNAYTPVSPYQFYNVAEIVSMYFANNENNQRGGMGMNHMEQARSIPREFRKPPRITTVPPESERAVVEATKSALFAEDDGIVAKADEHEIVIDTKNGLKTYYMDAVLTINSTTDQRYTPLVHQGDKVHKGDVVADGAFTKDGELCQGLEDVVCAYIPMTVFESIVKGIELTGPRDGGTNNNDCIIITEDLAEMVKTHEIAKVTYSLPKGTVLAHDKDDDSFDEKGLLKVGIKVEFDDLMMDMRVPNPQENISKMEVLADETNTAGRTSRPQYLTKKIRNGVIERVEVHDDKVDYYVGYDRGLEPGDKMTKGGKIGDKGTIVAVVPKGSLGSYIDDGKEVDIQAAFDPLSLDKRGINTIKGTLSLALSKLDEHIYVSPDETDLLNITAQYCKKANIPLDSMFEWRRPDWMTSEYLPGGAMMSKVRVISTTLLPNNHESADGENRKGVVTADRMGLKGLESMDSTGTVKREIEEEKKESRQELIKTGMSVFGVGRPKVIVR